MGIHYRDLVWPGDWEQQAACKQLPRTLRKDFTHPTVDQDGNQLHGLVAKQARAAATARALKVCAHCPVRQQCKEWAYRNCLDADWDGILGGETANERYNNRRKRGPL